MLEEATRSTNDPGENLVETTPTRPGRGWQWWPGLCLALSVLYVALPYGRLAGTLYVVAAIVAAAGVAAASYRQSHFRPTAWMLVAGALALAAKGHAIWYWLDLHELEPFPSFADIFYLAVYPLLMGALWILGHDTATRSATPCCNRASAIGRRTCARPTCSPGSVARNSSLRG